MRHYIAHIINHTHWDREWDWPAGVELILAVGEFSTSATNYATGPLSSEACFDLTAVELSPGDEVFVSGVGIDKSLVVTNFSVVLDVLNNSLSGTASPEGSVFACADNTTGNCRFATADENGDWTMAPDPEGFVLAPGVYGWAAEGDEDGDMTRMDWWAPMPTSGRATGEGWFISPTGAYAANPAYTGEASLEFDAKYVNKKPNLYGSLQFSFPRFSFDSTTLDWLLVDNGRMLLSGQGKISGKNDYSFMLSAVDNPPGMNGKDTVHIRIWETATGNVIYDNMPGIPDYEMPISILQGDGITLIQ